MHVDINDFRYVLLETSEPIINELITLGEIE